MFSMRMPRCSRPRPLTLNAPLGLTGGGLLELQGAVTSTVPVVLAGGTLVTERIVASELRLTNGAVLTCLATTATQVHQLEVEVGTLVVSVDSRIDVSGKGYLSGRTAGNATEGAATDRSGDSYGGLGRADAGEPNSVYGDYADPNQPGSGSGPATLAVSSAGGGLVRIQAGTLHLDGEILANGAEGSGAASSGGSGGGIYTAVAMLRGSGLIRAGGGNGGVNPNNGGAGGAGGGGRIALYAGDFGDFDTLRIIAPGGTGPSRGRPRR